MQTVLNVLITDLNFAEVGEARSHVELSIASMGKQEEDYEILKDKLMHIFEKGKPVKVVFFSD